MSMKTLRIAGRKTIVLDSIASLNIMFFCYFNPKTPCNYFYIILHLIIRYKIKHNHQLQGLFYLHALLMA